MTGFEQSKLTSKYRLKSIFGINEFNDLNVLCTLDPIFYVIVPVSSFKENTININKT